MIDRNTQKPAQSEHGENPVGLSPRQAEIAQAIEQFIREKGYAPAYSEIGLTAGVSRPTIKFHVDRLISLELFTRATGARTLVRTSRPYFVKEKKAA